MNVRVAKLHRWRKSGSVTAFCTEAPAGSDCCCFAQPAPAARPDEKITCSFCFAPSATAARTSHAPPPPRHRRAAITGPAVGRRDRDGAAAQPAPGLRPGGAATDGMMDEIPDLLPQLSARGPGRLSEFGMSVRTLLTGRDVEAFIDRKSSEIFGW